MFNSLLPRAPKSAPARRRFLSVALVAALFAALLPTGFVSVVPTVEAVSTTIVISQVYGGGGNAGSTYRQDFIELFNRGTSPQSLNGWSVQYASATGTTWATTNLTNVTLQPGQYYLVREAQGAGGTTDLPTADVTGTIAMSATAGKVALSNSTTALTGACPTGAAIVDFVGFGATANCFEGTGPTPAPSNTNAVLRGANGCTDTDQNATDFTAGGPTPPNTSTALAPCGGGGGTPTLNVGDVTQAEGSGGGTTNFNFTVSLTSAAGAGGVTFNWNTSDGTAQDDNPATEDNDYVPVTSGSGSITSGNTSTTITVQVNADTTGEPNETFFVNITNVVGATPGDVTGQGNISNDDVTVTPIYNIQGSGMSSPMAGQTNISTTGIVTARRSLGASNNGFYIQDPNGDGNLNTSDAILVFTGSTVPTVGVGDSVQVTGTIVEFESSTTDEPDGVAPPDPKTATEITSPTTVVLSTGNPLPAALDSTSLNILDPAATSRGAELEKYEYMRISVASLTVSQPTNGFGEFWGVEPPRPRPFREPGIERGDPIPAADEGPHAGSPPPNVPVWDGNFERIMVDTGAALVATGSTRRTQVQVTTGTVVTGIVGPLDYAFDQYRIVLDYNVTPGTSGGLTAAAPVPVRTITEFTVGHTNLENFSSSNATKMNKASLAIRNVLRTPDILGLIEVDTAASATALANKVNLDADDPTVNYVAYFGETSATQDIGYLVNSARVTVVGTPQQYNAGTTFNYCGVNDTLHDRPSFILEATVPQTGGGTIPVTVILNHTKSLIAVDSPRPFGSCGTGTEGARNREKRRRQAEDIADLIESRNAENLVVLGDLNAFEFNDGLYDVVGTFQGTPPPPDQVVEPSTDRWDHQLTNLLTKLTPDQRYSYTFEGNAQTLDHVLVNQQMLARNNRFAYARLNADFSDSFASDSSRPEAVSDHDAPVAYFATAEPVQSGQFIISEYRLRGPGSVVSAGPVRRPGGRGTSGGEAGYGFGESAGIDGEPQPTGTPDASPAANDEFIEFYNNTDSPITVMTTDGSAGWALAASDDGQVRFIIPNGTVIPARGHFLAVNSNGYSLSSYPADNSGSSPTTAVGDQLLLPGDVMAFAYNVEISDNAGIALFNSATTLDATTRLDSVGSASTPAGIFKEGTGVPDLVDSTGTSQYSYFRKLESGFSQDTQDNANDFRFVDTVGTCRGASCASPVNNLGAPGPENLSSPVVKSAATQMQSRLIDPAVSSSQSPNRVRDASPAAQNCGTNSCLGTLSIRRTFINNTGQPVTRLRFRVVDITTFRTPIPAGAADVRALTNPSPTFVVTTSSGPMTIQRTEVEGISPNSPSTSEPAQPVGGGYNTSLTVTLGSSIPPGESVNVEFLLGVMQGGSFRFFVIVEALP